MPPRGQEITPLRIAGGILGRLLGAVVFSRRKARHPSVLRGVTDDWLRALPRDKTGLFDDVVRRWECTFAMMSVALDGALSARTSGKLVCARQQVSIAAELLGRLTVSLVSFCDALAARGRRIQQLPAVEPLNQDFFRGDIGRHAASWNALLHHVLFRDRSRFFHKLRILSETLERLDKEFDAGARDLVTGLSLRPADCWKRLDHLHYDFATCLREAEVLFKSFLRALPAEHLPALAADLDAPPAPKRLRFRPRLSNASC